MDYQKEIIPGENTHYKLICKNLSGNIVLNKSKNNHTRPSHLFISIVTVKPFFTLFVFGNVHIVFYHVLLMILVI